MAAQVVAGAQTTKINSSGSSATGVTFTTKGPDGKRHVGAGPQAPVLSRPPRCKLRAWVLFPLSGGALVRAPGSCSHRHLHRAAMRCSFILHLASLRCTPP